MSNLLTLPPEIKNMIYPFVLIANDDIDPAHPRRNGSTSSLIRPTTAILQVCRQLYFECAPIYYGANTFHISATIPSQEGPIGWLWRIGGVNRGFIRRLKISWRGGYECAWKAVVQGYLDGFPAQNTADDGELVAMYAPLFARLVGLQGGFEEQIRAVLRCLADGFRLEYLSLDVPGSRNERALIAELATPALKLTFNNSGICMLGPLERSWFWDELVRLRNVRVLRLGSYESWRTPAEAKRRVEESDAPVEGLVLFEDDDAFELRRLSAIFGFSFDKTVGPGWEPVEGGKALRTKIARRGLSVAVKWLR